MDRPCNPSDCLRSCSNFTTHPDRITIKFKAYSPKYFTSDFTIVNVTAEPQIIFVSNPITEFFEIRAPVFKNCIYPNESIKIKVILKTNLSPRIHYDAVTVNCSQNCSVVVDLEAVPVVKPLKFFPRILPFGKVRLGETKVQKLVIPPRDDEDTPFLIRPAGCNPDLSIEPYAGIVKKGGKPVEIQFQYKPTAFVTLHERIYAYLPSLLSSPYVFSVTATTLPCLERDFILTQKSHQRPKYKGKPIISIPLSQLKKSREASRKKRTVWSHHETVRLLIENKLKRSPHELLGPLGRYLDEEETMKRGKESDFLRRVIKTRREDDMTKFHYKTKLRNEEVTDRELEKMWALYKGQLEGPKIKVKDRAIFVRQRILTNPTDITKQFTEKLPNDWFPRYVTMGKFIEAGRKVVAINRLLQVLRKLRAYTKTDLEKFEQEPVDEY